MNHSLDARWYTRLSEALINTEHEWAREFMHMAIRARPSFEEGEVENPKFTYVIGEGPKEALPILMQLAHEVDTEEKHPVVRELYLGKITFQIERLRLLVSIDGGDDREFFRRSSAVYGAPREDLFSYVAARVQALLASAPHTTARRALDGVFSKVDTESPLIDPNVLPRPQRDDVVVDAKRAREVFLQTLERYGIDDWEVVCDAAHGRPRFAVNAQRKTIHIPADNVLRHRQTPLTEIHVRALAEHEVGVHVRRAHEGMRQPLQLLALGLAGHVRGEEGIAGYVQQQIEGAKEFYGFDRYLAASLAVGMDGTPRDFRSVYELMLEYYLLLSSHFEGEEERARHAAWDVCVRLFRGTSGTGVGTIFTRDILYLEGNIGIWQLLLEKPHIFDSLFVGKFDPLSTTHVTALQALNILPSW